MKLSSKTQARHFYVTRHGISQEAVNKILRPLKRRFAGSKKSQPKRYMSIIAQRELQKYQNPNRYQYHFYHAWDPLSGPWDTCRGGVYVNWVLKINRAIPPKGPRVRLVDHNGDPIFHHERVYTRKKKRGGKRRTIDVQRQVQKSFSFDEDLQNAYGLMEQVFSLLEEHQDVYEDGKAREGCQVYGPFPEIHCRDGACYQSCNFSRFSPIWMIYLNALTPQGYLDSAVHVSLSFDEVPKGYKNKRHQGPQDLTEGLHRLEHYKSRVYQIIHSGYDIYRDTKAVSPEEEKYVDGTHVYTRPVLAEDGNTVVGYIPDLPNLQNSDYMADYMNPFVSQIKKWLGQHSCVSLTTEPNYLNCTENGRLRCKMTIEPSKPRLCYNARPLAGVMKKLPCKLDDLGVVLPLLQKGMYGCVSDDKQGKFPFPIFLKYNRIS